MNQIFLKGLFTTVDRTTRKYAFQALTSFYLPHYKCPERHLHNEILEIDMLIPDTELRHVDSVSNFCAANWFPCYKETRHLACFDPFRLELCHENSSSPDSRFISNHPIYFRRGLLVAICFFVLFCFVFFFLAFFAK